MVFNFNTICLLHCVQLDRVSTEGSYQENTNFHLFITGTINTRNNGFLEFFIRLLELSDASTLFILRSRKYLKFHVNRSILFHSFVEQVMFKCCKLIPVLIGGIIIQNKKYGLLDFVAATLMCIGLVLFTLADSVISPRFDPVGVVMISCALLCDGTFS